MFISIILKFVPLEEMTRLLFPSYVKLSAVASTAFFSRKWLVKWSLGVIPTWHLLLEIAEKLFPETLSKLMSLECKSQSVWWPPFIFLDLTQVCEVSQVLLFDSDAEQEHFFRRVWLSISLNPICPCLLPTAPSPGWKSWQSWKKYRKWDSWYTWKDKPYY